MTLRRPEETFVRTERQLYDLWRGLMGPGGFDQRSLWMIFLYPDGGLAPAITPIDGIPLVADEVFLHNLAGVVSQVFDGAPGTAAFLFSRPGTLTMTANDRAWARALRRAIDPVLSPWPVHLATRDRVQVFAPDDVIE